MIDIEKLSTHYNVNYLNKNNLNEILNIAKNNKEFYKHTDALPTKENIINDMTITPPGIDKSKKYYIGFYQQNELIAIMDLIDGYPSNNIAYIGFFMMNKSYENKGIGSNIIKEVENYLKTINKKSIHLAIDKGNPQSTNFWKKNGFSITSEAKKNNYIKLKAEKNIL